MPKNIETMSALQELYQEVILDHNKSPRNFGTLEDANRSAEGYNPLCGDHYKLELKVEDGIIRDVKFSGAGCAISKASASVMTLMIKGKTEEEIRRMFDIFHSLVTGTAEPGDDDPVLSRLAVFAGVREFPTRVKCATLAWHTLRAALETRERVVSTE